MIDGPRVHVFDLRDYEEEIDPARVFDVVEVPEVGGDAMTPRPGVVVELIQWSPPEEGEAVMGHLWLYIRREGMVMGTVPYPWGA